MANLAGSQGYQPNKLFTVKEANAMLPLVTAIVNDLRTLGADVMERQRRLEHLGVSNRRKGDFHDDEVLAIQDSIQADVERMGEFVGELGELGVECKGILEGLVDFPAWLNDRVVFLCWKLGEPEVRHWHEIDAGFTGRKPVTGLVFTPAGAKEASTT